jgi:hypothetical protein
MRVGARYLWPPPLCWFNTGYVLDSTRVGGMQVASVFEAVTRMCFVSGVEQYPPRFPPVLVYKLKDSYGSSF